MGLKAYQTPKHFKVFCNIMREHFTTFHGGNHFIFRHNNLMANSINMDLKLQTYSVGTLPDEVTLRYIKLS